MAYASISGTVLNVSGLTVGQQYAMMLYCLYPGNTSYVALVRQPSSGTVAAGTTTWSFNISSYVGNAGTYQFYVHIYAPGQSPQNTDTNVVSYTTQPQTVKVMIYNFLDDSTQLVSGSYTGYPGGIFYITYSGTQYQTYSVTYEFQYFGLSSDGFQGAYSASTGITISDGLVVYAYYKTRLAPVTPTVTQVTADANSATVYWAANGGDGTSGYWTLFYRTATGADISYGNIGSSPVTVTGLSPGTTYYFKVRHTVNGSYLDSSYVSATTLAPVSPTITSVTTTKDSATVYWSSNGGAAGYWTLFYQMGTGAYVSYGNISSSPVTITGLTAGTTYYFMVRHTLGGTYADSTSVSATTKNPIALFYWTSDDSSKIKAGELITNITASAWSNLISKIAACGGSTASIPTATSGGKLTAEHFNQMRNAISGLTGAGTVVSAVTKGTKILATMFANSTTALKESINRAINTKNS